MLTLEKQLDPGWFVEGTAGRDKVNTCFSRIIIITILFKGARVF
jgi:hypothetical protein